jgi:apolipoprotein N-acyltransferase
MMAFVMLATPWLSDEFVFVGWFGAALALHVMGNSKQTLMKFLGFYVSSCLMMSIAFYWSPAAMAYTLSSDLWLGYLVTFPLVAWEGLRLTLSFWLGAAFTKDKRFLWLSVSCTAILLEYAMPSVFPWKLGLTQLSLPWLLQGIDIFGSSYSTMVFFALAGLVQSTAAAIITVRFRKEKGLQDNFSSFRALSSCYPPLVFLAINGAYSAVSWEYWSRASESAPKICVGMVQVDPSYVDSLEAARNITEQIAEGADLICWPESSGGTYDLRLAGFSDNSKTFELSQEPERGLRPWPNPKCELLIGGKNYGVETSGGECRYVTAMLIDKEERIKGRYNKRYLMPFGEYVPGEAYLPGLAQLFDMDEKINRGASVEHLSSVTGARIGTLLCYEDMVPASARELANGGSNILISLINASAFESTHTLYQHRLLAQARAIECRRWFLRCSATGETCVISPMGDVKKKIPSKQQGSLVCEVGLFESHTVWCRAPYLLPICCVVALATLCVPRKVVYRIGVYILRVCSLCGCSAAKGASSPS